MVKTKGQTFLVQKSAAKLAKNQRKEIILKTLLVLGIILVTT
jgi:hypothetical protein